MSANYDDKATSLESKESNEHLDDVDHVDFNRNTTARIQNPLHGLSRKTLHERADTFATETSVDVDRDLLYKAIVLAQRPSEFETNEDLTEADREALRLERDHRWKQPFILYFTVFLCSLGAAVQGWDQTGSNGANLSFPQEFGIPLDDPVHAEANEWLVGVINAGPYIGSALLGCPISDPLNTWIGRRGVIFVSAIFCCFPVLAQGFTQSWEQLFICRLLLGIGMGVKGSTIPIYAAENVPTAIRGGLVMSWQLWTAFGICVGFAFNLIFKDMGPLAWRFQLSCAFAPAVPLAALIYLCPESPRWLMKKGNQAKAWRSFCRLRNTELQAARDMILVWSQLREEAAIIKPASYLVRVKELFTIPRVRRATLASFIVMLGQQMCGINIIAFYSSTVFAIAGYNTTQCLLASFGFGLVNFIFAFPAVYTIDTFGRRSLLLATFPNMACFAAFYSPGEGPVPFTYSAEVFPLSHREVGMAWAVATCLGWAAVLGITFPRMVGALTITGAFCFYAGLNVTALVMIFFALPETKQRTLEELDDVFSVPTSKFAAYQCGTWLPWFFKRYIAFNKRAELAPLYDFDESELAVSAKKPTRVPVDDVERL